MRPTKRINPGSHYSGTAGKGRYYTTGLPAEPEPTPELLIVPADSDQADTSREALPEKYVGRASVGANAREEALIDLTEPREWVDPLDQDEFDLSSVTIDLRPTLRRDAPDSYYERYSSRVPGHQ